MRRAKGEGTLQAVLGLQCDYGLLEKKFPKVRKDAIDSGKINNQLGRLQGHNLPGKKMKSIFVRFILGVCFVSKAMSQESNNKFFDSQVAIESADIDLDNGNLLTGGVSLRFWDCEEKISSYVFRYNEASVMSLKLYDNSTKALICTTSLSIDCYDFAKGEVIFRTDKIRSLVYEIYVIDDVAFLGCADGSIYRMNLTSKSINRFHYKDSHPIVGMKICGKTLYYVNNRHLVSVNLDNTIKFSQVEIKGCNSLDFSDGIAYVGCFDSKVVIVKDFKIIKTVNTGLVGAVKYLGYREYVLIYGENQNIELWDFEKDTLCTTFKGHELPVKSILINKKKNEFYSTSRDGTVRYWSFQKFINEK